MTKSLKTVWLAFFHKVYLLGLHWAGCHEPSGLKCFYWEAKKISYWEQALGLVVQTPTSHIRVPGLDSQLSLSTPSSC